MTNRLIIIVGPTASGKTETACKLARAVNGEIISADSMQVYKGMEILSQAPRNEDLGGIPYYLVSHVDPEKEYSAALFAGEASGLITEIVRRKNIPVITGGTGLYVRALIDGLFPAPPKDVALRKRLETKALEEGGAALHQELLLCDPESAGNIHPNDTKRIIRALEIYYLTGIPKSAHVKDTVGIKDNYEVIMAGIDLTRPGLYERIDRRVEKMFSQDIVGEVKRLRGLKLGITAGMALGIQEITGYLDGAYGLDEAKGLLKKNTRRYAKRQMTWFRADKRVRWFSDGEGVISYCRDII
ncbi:MAG: tRNA (adenosine(37)-N6)-dimethylallyltransferase MiaA [Candidatus Omnitrophica bacterium]|nr:tRNA (adenosine(37)-N6)-dimethylallyltransferase MiaA [Candidatus Omnitrophota bacterium]